MDIIMILGSPNADDGQLYDVAISRCRLALVEFEKNPAAKFLLTGGFGAHFNRSSKPHAAYLEEYLLKAGVKRDSVLEYAESANTIEDATLSKPVIEKYKAANVTIITSDYHLARAEYIFREIYQDLQLNLTFLAAPSDEEQSELDIKDLKKHEANALQKLKTTGIANYYSGGK
ncbi:MAG TPA: YdcF family protein [Bacillota bacterium]|nr:YdcF family protein [Bacillota bacterium]